MSSSHASFFDVSGTAISGAASILQSIVDNTILRVDIDGIQKILAVSPARVVVYFASMGNPFVVAETAFGGPNPAVFYLLSNSYTTVLLTGTVGSTYTTPAISGFPYSFTVTGSSGQYNDVSLRLNTDGSTSVPTVPAPVYGKRLYVSGNNVLVGSSAVVLSDQLQQSLGESISSITSTLTGFGTSLTTSYLSVSGNATLNNVSISQLRVGQTTFGSDGYLRAYPGGTKSLGQTLVWDGSKFAPGTVNVEASLALKANLLGNSRFIGNVSARGSLAAYGATSNVLLFQSPYLASRATGTYISGNVYLSGNSYLGEAVDSGGTERRYATFSRDSVALCADSLPIVGVSRNTGQPFGFSNADFHVTGDVLTQGNVFVNGEQLATVGYVNSIPTALLGNTASLVSTLQSIIASTAGANMDILNIYDIIDESNTRLNSICNGTFVLPKLSVSGNITSNGKMTTQTALVRSLATVNSLSVVGSMSVGADIRAIGNIYAAGLFSNKQTVGVGIVQIMSCGSIVSNSISTSTCFAPVIQVNTLSVASAFATSLNATAIACPSASITALSASTASIQSLSVGSIAQLRATAIDVSVCRAATVLGTDILAAANDPTVNTTTSLLLRIGSVSGVDSSPNGNNFGALTLYTASLDGMFSPNTTTSQHTKSSFAFDGGIYNISTTGAGQSFSVSFTWKFAFNGQTGFILGFGSALKIACYDVNYVGHGIAIWESSGGYKTPLYTADYKQAQVVAVFVPSTSSYTLYVNGASSSGNLTLTSVPNTFTLGDSTAAAKGCGIRDVRVYWNRALTATEARALSFPAVSASFGNNSLQVNGSAVFSSDVLMNGTATLPDASLVNVGNTTLSSLLGSVASSTSPVFTGTVSLPASTLLNSVNLSALISSLAPKVSPTFTGTVALPDTSRVTFGGATLSSAFAVTIQRNAPTITGAAVFTGSISLPDTTAITFENGRSLSTALSGYMPLTGTVALPSGTTYGGQTLDLIFATKANLSGGAIFTGGTIATSGDISTSTAIVAAGGSFKYPSYGADTNVATRRVGALIGGNVYVSGVSTNSVLYIGEAPDSTGAKKAFVSFSRDYVSLNTRDTPRLEVFQNSNRPFVRANTGVLVNGDLSVTGNLYMAAGNLAFVSSISAATSAILGNAATAFNTLGKIQTSLLSDPTFGLTINNRLTEANTRLNGIQGGTLVLTKVSVAGSVSVGAAINAFGAAFKTLSVGAVANVEYALGITNTQSLPELTQLRQFASTYGEAPGVRASFFTGGNSRVDSVTQCPITDSVGTVVWSTGSAVLKDSGSILSATIPAPPVAGQSVSLAFWLFVPDATDSGANVSIVTLGDLACTYLNTGVLRVSAANNASAATFDASVLQQNAWTHVHAGMSTDGFWSLWLGGELQVALSRSTTINTSALATVSTRALVLGPFKGAAFRGVAVLDSAPSALKDAKLSGFVCIKPFVACAPGLVVSLSANSLNVDEVGSGATIALGGTQSTCSRGKCSESISVSLSTYTGTTHSVSFWLLLNSAVASGDELSWIGSNSTGAGLVYFASGVVQLKIASSGTATCFAAPPFSAWTHISYSLVDSATKWQLYYDGEPQVPVSSSGTSAIPASLTPSSFCILVLGAAGGLSLYARLRLYLLAVPDADDIFEAAVDGLSRPADSYTLANIHCFLSTSDQSFAVDTSGYGNRLSATGTWNMQNDTYGEYVTPASSGASLSFTLRKSARLVKAKTVALYVYMADAVSSGCLFAIGNDQLWVTPGFVCALSNGNTTTVFEASFLSTWVHITTRFSTNGIARCWFNNVQQTPSTSNQSPGFLSGASSSSLYLGSITNWRFARVRVAPGSANALALQAGDKLRSQENNSLRCAPGLGYCAFADSCGLVNTDAFAVRFQMRTFGDTVTGTVLQLDEVSLRLVNGRLRLSAPSGDATFDAPAANVWVSATIYRRSTGISCEIDGALAATLATGSLLTATPRICVGRTPIDTGANVLVQRVRVFRENAQNVACFRDTRVRAQSLIVTQVRLVDAGIAGEFGEMRLFTVVPAMLDTDYTFTVSHSLESLKANVIFGTSVLARDTVCVACQSALGGAAYAVSAQLRLNALVVKGGVSLFAGQVYV